MDGLDGVIREIRNTIFRLPGRTEAARSLRDEMLRLGDKHRDELGFTPRIAFHGPVDASVPEAVSSEVLQVLGEGLSNVARHARASSVEVVVSVEDGWLSLSIADDGIGIAEGPRAGQRRAQHGDSGVQSRGHLHRLSPRPDRDDASRGGYRSDGSSTRWRTPI